MEKITATVLTVIGALLVTAVVSKNTELTTVSHPGLQNTSSNDSISAEDEGESNTTTSVIANTTSSSTTPEKVQSPENKTSINNTASPGSVTKTTPSKIAADTVTPGPKTDNSSNKPDSTTVRGKTSPSKPATTQQTMTKKPPVPSSNNRITYIIIFTIVMVCLIVAIVYCCFQNKTRRFSLEHSKNEDAQIPLSAVEPEVFEASPPKDMQTFSAAEFTIAANSAPPADGAEKQEGEKATEPNQQEKESSTGTQTTVPLSDKPSELTVVDLSDGDPAISTKTSVESLDVPLNENNSNNRAQANMRDFSGDFTEISLDDGL
ncbi:cell wall protein DAN4 isoform X2 [Pygocentrus nattereri]|uniref:cell wall protein DAN4 isoform X2 n=1 Tax=Pygocentrus nattereri TaxID=42514 RepID=UPI000814B070|nr:cell wall protein DAN4 isoform X2 [Pygocentrus nattereri]